MKSFLVKIVIGGCNVSSLRSVFFKLKHKGYLIVGNSFFADLEKVYFLTILHNFIHSGIVSSVLTNNGEGFYPGSPSEFVRFSLAARSHTKPDCTVDFKPGVRPPLPEPVVADGEAAPEAEPERPEEDQEQPVQVAEQEAAAAVPAEQAAV